jgi:hypothetical protein
MASIVRPPDDATTIENAFRAHLENPFFVLALPPEASAAEIDRQSQKWLSMLAADLPEARRYATPFGAGERTADLVRTATAELADPMRRLSHEWWARGFPGAPAVDGSGSRGP